MYFDLTGTPVSPVPDSDSTVAIVPIGQARMLKASTSMRGMGRIFKRGSTYWIAYFHRGQEIRESSHSTKEGDARRLLKKRLGEIGRGRLVGPAEERVMFDEIAAEFVRDYEIKGRRSIRTARERVRHLTRFFGVDRAIDITTPRIRTFAQSRLAEGAKPATINRDLAALGRMFALAIQGDQLTSKPHIPKLKESSPRQGFFEHEEYLAIRRELPEIYQDILAFGYYSGWRHGEILTLLWSDVDLAAGVVRLRPEVSKNSEGRVLPLSPPLREVIDRRWGHRAPKAPFVFHRGGRAVGSWRKTWIAGCVAAGLFRVVKGQSGTERTVPTKMFHDLRRTAVRNLIRAGVPERVAMTITGHKTRSVFDRYNIVSEADLRGGADRLASYLSARGTDL